MATAARGESSNPYGGLGTGGKFRKPTARRSQKTPYDRPLPTNSARSSGIGGGGGWFSKFVDPAQRIIAYSANRFLASVFRKRLGSGETPVQSPEQNQIPQRDVIKETRVGRTEDIAALSMRSDLNRVENTNGFVNPAKDGFVDLEKILKEKTFTRSEVDRLTTLLRSKAGDSSTGNREQRNEVSVVRHPPSQERVHPENGSMNALVSTPLKSSRAVDECIASPAQLAKAYMGNRPSEVTPSMLRSRGQGVREDSVFLNRTPFPSKSPTTSMVPKPSGQRALENGFITPRSRGRSAVYSMARTPYSRPQSAVKVGSLIQASPSIWEESLSSGPRQGFQSGTKRRSSVLDNDIGSVGPVRRIRQKSNLSSRSLALPASESPLSVRASGGQKSIHSFTNVEDTPGSNFYPVPSQSRQMASKILDQLDKLVTPREKSPSKLSPSMLRGQALKSLQTVEAPKFLDNLPEKKANSPVSSFLNQKKSRASGSGEALTTSEKTGAVDGTSKIGSSEDQEARGKGAYMPLTSSLEEHPPKKRAFRMSALEDLEWDDDHVASTSSAVAEKPHASKVAKSPISMLKGEKQLTSSVAMPSTSVFSNGEASQGTPNGFFESERSKFAASPVEAVQQSNMASEPTSQNIQETEKSSLSPGKLFSEEKVVSLEEPKKAVAVFPTIFSSPSATDFSQNAGASADIKLEKTSSSAFGGSEASAKPTESNKAVSTSASEAEPNISGSGFSVEANAVSPPPNNGFLFSSPSFPPSNSSLASDNYASKVPSTVESVAATPSVFSGFGKLPVNTSNDNNSGSNSQSTSAPLFSSTSPTKLWEPPAQFASTVSASTGQISKEAEAKNSTFGNLNNFKFGAMTSADTSTGNDFATKSSEIESKPGFELKSSAPAVPDAGSTFFGGTPSVVGGSTFNPFTAASSAPGSSGSSVVGVTFSSTTGTDTTKISVPTTASNTFGTFSTGFTSSSTSMPGGVSASSASSVFGFNAVSSDSAASAKSQASTIVGTTDAKLGNTGSGITTQSVPFQFGSSAPAPIFTFSGNTSFASNSSPFDLSKSAPLVFGAGSTLPLSSTNTSASSTGTTSSSVFGNWQAPSSAPSSAPVFSSQFTPSSTPTFNFGGTSAATASTASASIFGTTTNAPSSPSIFSFNSTAPTTTQQPGFSNSTPSATLSPFGNSAPVFGNSTPVFGNSTPGFGNSTPGFAFSSPTNNTNVFNGNQQTSMEDSMAEDTVQANKTPVFGGQAFSMPQQNMVNGGPNQFGGPNSFASTQQISSPFQQSQSSEFQGGGSSFSLGSTGGGGDKLGRRIFKAKKSSARKK